MADYTAQLNKKNSKQTVTMTNSIALGMDIGGSHVTAALVDLNKNAFIESSYIRSFVDSTMEAGRILDAWSQTIREAYNGYETVSKTIGIAMPGPFDYENGISLIKDQGKFKNLYGINIRQALAERLNIPASGFFFINDAAAFLKGEIFYDRPAALRQNALGITLGTGLGSAIYCNGKVEDAALWDAPFLNGIAEDYFSTRWFVNSYQRLTGCAINGAKELLEIVHTDANAARLFDEFASSLAQFLTPLIKKHHAEVVIIGGNISGASDVFLSPLKKALEENGLYSEIKITTLKEHASLMGAACCTELEVINLD